MKPNRFILRTSDSEYLCFNHACIAVQYGIPIEIIENDNFNCCEWCKFGIPGYIQNTNLLEGLKK